MDQPKRLKLELVKCEKDRNLVTTRLGRSKNLGKKISKLLLLKKLGGMWQVEPHLPAPYKPVVAFSANGQWVSRTRPIKTRI